MTDGKRVGVDDVIAMRDNWSCEAMSKQEREKRKGNGGIGRGGGLSLEGGAEHRKSG